MDYQTLIPAAITGDPDALEELYQSTYRNHYYLALKFMNHPADAEDVLEDAFLKAWSALPSLSDPNRFPAWTQSIVLNTAKNQLKKRNPLLFSDLSSEDNKLYELEDVSPTYQPELHYNQQETQELVRELINSLSDEQRVCILLFHLEGKSIREIADTFHIPENTVKSRLNYGRKALQKKADDLEKNGWKLYSIAPLPLLLLLLHSEQAGLSIPPAPPLPQKRTFPTHSPLAENGAAQAGAASAKHITSHVTGNMTRAAVIKIIAAAAGGVLLIGSAAVLAFPLSSRSRTPTPSSVITEPCTASDTVTKAPQSDSPAAEALPSRGVLNDEDYASVIAGNLSKQEFAYLLAQVDYGQRIGTNIGLLCANNEYITAFKEGGEFLYSLSDVNRYLSALTDFQITPETAAQADAEIVGNNIRLLYPFQPNSYSAEIISTQFEPGMLKIVFLHTTYFHSGPPEESIQTEERIAFLTPRADGLYVISSIDSLAT